MASINFRQMLGVSPQVRARVPGGIATPTIASGVLTISGNALVVNPLPESSTSDTVDSIVTKPAARAGDIIFICVPATNTITFDNSATLLLGAATRAVAPNGCLGLVFDGTSWNELFFLAAAS
jgi:hypothetical protein